MKPTMPITSMSPSGRSRSGRRRTYRNPSTTRASAADTRSAMPSRYSSAGRIRYSATSGTT
ncbi:MAG: hypothetical protein AUI14_17555 [Actinobacteria bacterium 13_2_20CM_2_71_6]|nr:MAG: hypothetical protein AUI14_17555 [Actinobacteria bacterium 13_2_20CM_2_71_6]